MINKTGTRLITSFKGGLISESFSIWLKSPKRGAKNYHEHYRPKENNSEMASLLGYLSQSENSSDIKLPLAIF